MMIRPVRSMHSSSGYSASSGSVLPTAAMVDPRTRIAPSSKISRAVLTVMIVAWMYSIMTAGGNVNGFRESLQREIDHGRVLYIGFTYLYIL